MNNIILYHKVDDEKNCFNNISVSVANFREQLIYLKNRYNVISLEELVKKKELSDSEMAITFDDGYDDFYYNAFPLIKELNIPVTVFITTSQLDKEEELWQTEIARIIDTGNFTDDNIFIPIKKHYISLKITYEEEKKIVFSIVRKLCLNYMREEREKLVDFLREQGKLKRRGRTNYKLLSKSNLYSISKCELVNIGCHTVTHPSLSKLGDKEAYEEIKNSKEYLEHVLKRAIDMFSYPFGGKYDVSQRDIEIVKGIGFKNAFSVEPIDSIYSDFSIPRTTVTNVTGNEFEYLLCGEKDHSTDIMQYKDSDYLHLISILGEKDIRMDDNDILIWGAGVNAIIVYNFIKHIGKESQIKAFIDNDPQKVGAVINSVPVISAGFLKKSNNNVSIIVKNNDDVNIIFQLLDSDTKALYWWV